MKCNPTVFLIVAASLLLSQRARADAEVDAFVARAAKYESGESAEPLRQLERLLCESVGAPERHAELESALLRLLAPDAAFEAKRFACLQLAVHGSEAALPALGGLFKQDETVGIACFALGGLRSAKAGDLLRAALPDARGTARLQIVEALGHRAEAASVKPLADLARDADGALARAAIRALGAVDAATAREAVAALRREAKPEVAGAVADASLNGAEQLVAAGDTAAAAALCTELLQPTGPRHIRRGAFGLLLRCDADGGAQRVRRTLDAVPPDAELTAVAIAHAVNLRGKGVSKSLGEALPRLPPAAQVLLIEALACRADSDARAIVLTQVGATDSGVRHAAVAAVGSLGDDSAVARLAHALTAAATPEETKDIQLAMASLRGGEKTERAIGDALRQAAAKDKVPLMAVLSRRGGPIAVSALLEQSGGSDEPVAREASQALVRIADGGDTASFAAVQAAAVGGGDARVREVALRTLTAWRGVAAWETLAGIYAKSANDAQHALVRRGLIRIASEGNAAPDAALIGRFRQLLDGASSDDDRKQILRVLSGVKHPDALALALKLLDVPGVRPEASEAVVQIANAIADSHPDAARAALQRVKDGKPTP